MTAADTLRFAAHAALGYRLRAALLVVAVAIGVAAVVALTALGDGVRRYVMNQFERIGSNLIFVLPGRTETGGVSFGTVVTSTPRDLTLDDAAAIARAPLVLRAAPVVVGLSEVAANGRLRETRIVGTTHGIADILHFQISQGRFLPAEDWKRPGTTAVIGETVRKDLFDAESGIGQMIRIGDRRLRVVGVIKATGQGLIGNIDEMVVVPAATAMALFNTNSLFRIAVEAHERDTVADTRTQIETLMRARHGGELDVTLITQDALLATFDSVLGALTLAVAGIAAISLAVAGILVMNVMLVAVAQRTAEVGLLKALGASGNDIVRVFLAEAALLSTAGAVFGYGLGQLAAWGIRVALPTLPAWPPLWAVAAALALALASGLAFGTLPARHAAALDPVTALARH